MKEKNYYEIIKRYLISKFRLAWRYYDPNRKKCLLNDRCEICKKVTKVSYRRADHVEPVINPTTGFVGWDDLNARLFHGKLQMLCTTCHDQKSKEENKLRKARRLNSCPTKRSKKTV